MIVARYLKEIAAAGRAGQDLDEEQAHDLFAAFLDGGVPDLELGACLVALHMKSESVPELSGFHRAVHERCFALRQPVAGLRPLVFPAYGGAVREPNLLPLVALMLRRIGVPVLLHGTLEGGAGVAAAYILRELGILPGGSLAQAQKSLDDDLLAFVPTAVLCPGLANLLALRNRLGVSNSAHKVVRLIDPFRDGGVRVVGVADEQTGARMGAFLAASGADALLLRSTDGEAFANPRQRPRIQLFRHGSEVVLFEEETVSARVPAGSSPEVDAVSTAQWIRLALEGRLPLPHPLVNQFACSLFASGYTDDMNQAKAIAAVEAGGLCLQEHEAVRETLRSRASF
jgi:anthranilate phosphoribosyltransferase